MVYVPKGADSIVDTWYVGGLRGTGSHDIMMDDVFVPIERTYTFCDPDQLDQPLSRMPFFATMAAGCAAMCLGIAGAALDTLIELGATKKQVGPMPGLCDRPAVQGMLGAMHLEEAGRVHFGLQPTNPLF